MCSVQEGDQPIPKKHLPSNSRDRQCMKCEEVAVIIIRVNDAFCRSCFLTYCTHKFRSAFGKSKVVRDGEQVLLGFSGGSGSCAMTHLVQEGLSKRAAKKLRFKPHLLYIDEGIVTNQSAEERQQTCVQIVEVMRQTELPFHVTSLEMALSDESELSPAAQPGPGEPLSGGALCEQLAKLQLDSATGDRLKALLASASTMTARESLVNILRRQVLTTVARKCGYSKVLVGDCATRLAVRLISDVTQGRGAHIALEMGFSDTRHGDITVIRPMREFTAKEVAMYNKLNDLDPVRLPTLTTMAGMGASLDRLTESFITGLQAEYPSTVSTVFRTGEKLEVSDKDFDDVRCLLCQAPLDTNVGHSSALGALHFSESLPSKGRTLHNSENEADLAVPSSEQGSECAEQDVKWKSSRHEVRASLCYGCQLVLKDVRDLDVLPPRVLQTESRQHTRSQMKEAISDCLLMEDSDR